MGDDPTDRRRWDDVPGNFEWRLLHLEKDRDETELRLRQLEGRQDVIETKLDTLIQSSAETKKNVETIKDDRYKTQIGFILMGLTVVGSAAVEHFLR